MSEKIKMYRERLGLTQSELARRAKVNRAYLNQIENERLEPGLSVLSRIAKVLGVSVKELL